MKKEITGLTTCIGIKQVDAVPMTKAEWYEEKGWPAEILFTQINGYKVEYSDGYISWTPKEVFEEAYRTILDMTWPMALYMLVHGWKVCRTGWNGKGMFVSYVPETAELGAYFIITNADGKSNTWVPSISDNLADDWKIAADI